MPLGRRLLEWLLVSTLVGVSVVVLLVAAGLLDAKARGEGVAMAKSSNLGHSQQESGADGGNTCEHGQGDDCGNGGESGGEHEGDSGDHGNGNEGNGNGGDSEGNGNGGDSDGDHDDGDDEENGEGEGPSVEPGECPAPGFVIDFAGLPAGTGPRGQDAARRGGNPPRANRGAPTA